MCRYAKHGAFWAIGILAAIMFIGATGHEVPEWITGLLGAAVIVVALISSVIANKKDAEDGTTEAAE